MPETLIHFAARAFEVAGVIAMLAGAAFAIVNYLRHRNFHNLRRQVAHAILIGLELLIAADIIATITVRPTLESVAVLGLIVLIRTFLSFTLELETTGRLPWQRTEPENPHPDDDTRPDNADVA